LARSRHSQMKSRFSSFGFLRRTNDVASAPGRCDHEATSRLEIASARRIQVTKGLAKTIRRRRKRWPPHKLMPNARRVALLVARLLLLPVRHLPLPLPVGPRTPLAPARRLMPSLEVKHTHNSRMNGMPPPAQSGAATCA
jgi:hypothetical protein